MVVPRSCPIPRVTLAPPCDGPIFALSFKRHVHLLHDARGGLFFGLFGPGVSTMVVPVREFWSVTVYSLETSSFFLNSTRLTLGSLRSFAGFVISLSVDANFETNL